MTRVRTRPLLFAVTLAAMLTAAALLPAAVDADAAALVESVYGERIKQVIASRETADDLELARELYRIAGSGADGPAVAVALCGRVYQLASRLGEGADLAVDAMRLSIKTRPADRAAFLEQAIAVQQRVYASARANDRTPAGESLIDLLVEAAEERRDAGAWADAAVFYRRALAVAGAIKSPDADAVRRALNDVQNRPKLEAKADQLKERLKSNPDDRAAAAALIDLYLVELDAPAEARKYTFLLADADFAARVKLAGTPAEELAVADLVAVGDLYRDLAARTVADNRPRMLVRSYRAYAEWLDRAASDAADRFRIELAFGDLKTQLTALGVDPLALHRPSADNRIELTAKPLVTLDGPAVEWVNNPSFSPDGKTIATASSDAAVRVYEASTGRLLHTLSEHKGYANYARYVGDGSTLVSAGGDGSVILWSASTNRPRARVNAGERRIYGFDVTADGRRAVTAANDGQVQCWNLGASTSPVNSHRFESAAHAAAIAPDGRTFAAAGEDRYIFLGDPASGAELARLPGHWNTVHGMAFSPDGRTLASASADGTVRLWDLATRSPLGFADRTDYARYRVAFSPDGRLLAVAGADRRVLILDSWFLTTAAAVDAQMDEVYGVAFDALGQRLVVTGKDKTARVFALNRIYHNASVPVTRNLPTNYFWCPTERVRKIDDNGVLWIMDDDEPLMQTFFAHTDGNYRIEIDAAAQLAGDEPPRLEIKLDSPERPAVTGFDVKSAATDSPDRLTADVTLKRGIHRVYLHFTNDYSESKKVDRNVAILAVRVVGVTDPAAATPPAGDPPSDAPAAPAPAPADSE